MTEAALTPDSRPRLAPGVRLHFDKARDAWVLLAPERVLQTEGPAQPVLSRCDGVRTLAGIVAELAAEYAAPEAEIAADVHDMLADLMAKRLVVV